MSDSPERQNDTTHLVRDAIAGDREAFARLYEHFYPFLLAQARLRIGDGRSLGCEAEDLAQEVWGVCLEKLSQIESRGGRFTPVLLRFLSSTMVNRVRSLRRLRLDQRLPGSNAEGDGSAEVEDQDAGVLTRNVRRESSDVVRSGLAVLAREDQDLLIMRGMEELPYKLIGQHFNRTADAMKKRYRECLGRLRAALPVNIVDDLAQAEHESAA